MHSACHNGCYSCIRSTRECARLGVIIEYALQKPRQQQHEQTSEGKGLTVPSTEATQLNTEDDDDANNGRQWENSHRGQPNELLAKPLTQNDNLQLPQLSLGNNEQPKEDQPNQTKVNGQTAVAMELSNVNQNGASTIIVNNNSSPIDGTIEADKLNASNCMDQPSAKNTEESQILVQVPNSQPDQISLSVGPSDAGSVGHDSKLRKKTKSIKRFIRQTGDFIAALNHQCDDKCSNNMVMILKDGQQVNIDPSNHIEENGSDGTTRNASKSNRELLQMAGLSHSCDEDNHAEWCPEIPFENVSC